MPSITRPGTVSTGDMKPGKSLFWRRMGRVIPLAVLLILLWGYVLPYQAGVQIDKALAVWMHNHAGWKLTRQSVGTYDRRYGIRWTGSSDTPPIRATLTVQNRPVGWPTGMGRQWGWATFSLALAPTSPIQLTRWPNDPWRWSGLIGWLGALDLHLPTTSPESGTAQLAFDPRSGRWSGTLNLPAWQLTTPDYTWRFGRSIVDLDLRVTDDSAQRRDISSTLGGLLGEIGVDIRRLGWVGPKDRGLVDGVQFRLRQVSRQHGHLRDVIGSASLESVQRQGMPWGAAQATFGLYDAQPEVIHRLFALGRTVMVSLPGRQTGRDLQPLLDEFAHGRAHDALSEVLITLRRAEVRLDAFRYQGPYGGFSVAGTALGPRHPASPSSVAGYQTVRYWQAHLAVQMDDAWLAQWPSALVRGWLPWLRQRRDLWVGSFEHGASGWRIQPHPVDISTFRPQD